MGLKGVDNMELYEKEVRFDIYCKTCKYRFESEVKDPCNECLSFPVKPYSSIPINWKSKSRN